MSRVKVVLVGPPGAGKTTVGSELAVRLGVAFLDTDAEVERTTGRTISEIFLDDGEEHFRALEHQAVIDTLGRHDGVLALGGGAILDERTRRSLDVVPVVFLDVSMAKAMPRVGMTGARPLLVGSPRAQWKILADARRPLYEEVAGLVLDTDKEAPDRLATVIASALEHGELVASAGRTV
ncbi:shikimate kinase [Georgenia sunbinii]|uniref:shikimate kinase n=1 Tax=Georgenia sunbinii TaxID=3117728 RepID=UPI002F26CABB